MINLTQKKIKKVNFCKSSHIIVSYTPTSPPSTAEQSLPNLHCIVLRVFQLNVLVQTSLTSIGFVASSLKRTFVVSRDLVCSSSVPFASFFIEHKLMLLLLLQHVLLFLVVLHRYLFWFSCNSIFLRFLLLNGVSGCAFLPQISLVSASDLTSP